MNFSTREKCPTTRFTRFFSSGSKVRGFPRSSWTHLKKHLKRSPYALSWLHFSSLFQHRFSKHFGMILKQKNTSENDHFRQQIWRWLFKQISLPKSLQNQALDSHEGLQKRSGFHWSNAMPFFDDFWSDFGSQNAANPPWKRHLKSTPKQI